MRPLLVMLQAVIIVIGLATSDVVAEFVPYTLWAVAVIFFALGKRIGAHGCLTASSLFTAYCLYRAARTWHVISAGSFEGRPEGYGFVLIGYAVAAFIVLWLSVGVYAVRRNGES